MIYADSKTVKHINAKNITESEEYHCPGCGKLVKARALESTKIRPHFYHERGSECSYATEHDMSPWHFEWQEQFPEECRETALPPEKPIHRADVWIYGRVVEFQHSPISQDAFDDRNEFYPKYCRELLWVFDMSGHFKEVAANCIKLKRRNDLFKGYELGKSSYRLFFEIKGIVYQILKMVDSTGMYEFDAESIAPKQALAMFLNQPVRIQQPIQQVLPQVSYINPRPANYGLRGPREQYFIGRNNNSYKGKKSNGRGKKR